MSKTNLRNPIALWIILSFIGWITIFFGFLSSKLALFEDATSYYEHTKFFVENLAKGIFPLWDPYWYNGAPNDFFLRRIGSFNPLYLFILLLKTLKLPYTYAYLWSLALYYWGGMIAFYLLAMRLYNNRLMAYAGYLILLFSTLGTRLFDSYMMLITVPLLWFFYCLVAFSQTPCKVFFFGLCLSLMTLSTTYIPFYFFSFFAFFVICFALFYFNLIPVIAQRYKQFFKEHKLIVVLSLIVLLLSLLPALIFFHKTSEGQVVLPARHGDIASAETLVVPSKALDWGAVEDLLFSYYFSNFRMIRFAVVYIPFFAFIIFALGLFCRISKRAIFMFTCGFVFLCCIVPRGLPFYDFLYQHIFFLKYFRNLHFFLWFALIPLFVLLVLEHWKIFSENKLRKEKLMLYVLGLHGLILLFVIFRADAIPSTYIMIALSIVFWWGTILGIWNQRWSFILLTLAIVVQPIEVYHYLNQRAQPFIKGSYHYDFPYNQLILKGQLPPPESFREAKGDVLYYASGPFNSVYQNVLTYPLAKYLQYKFILVDHVEAVDPHQVDSLALQKYFLSQENKAFIFKENGDLNKISSKDTDLSSKALRIEKEDEHFKILSFNANHLKIMVDLPHERFLVYNDSYDPSWNVRINGKKGHIYQTNVAFKGVWLPRGKNIVEFYYGKKWQYGLNIFLLMAGLVFLLAIFVSAREKSSGKEGC